MLGKLFGFGGRMGRLSYFGWACAGGFVWAVGFFVVLGGAFGASLAKGSILGLVGASLAALLDLIPMIWMGLALSTKRLRDAGFPPIIVVPVMMAFSLFDILVLSRQTGRPMLGGFVHNSPVGLCVNLVYGCVLLFWPSADITGDGGTSESRRSGEVPWYERPLDIASTRPAQAASDPFPSQALAQAAGQPRTFGRRRA